MRSTDAGATVTSIRSSFPAAPGILSLVLVKSGIVPVNLREKEHARWDRTAVQVKSSGTRLAAGDRLFEAWQSCYNGENGYASNPQEFGRGATPDEKELANGCHSLAPGMCKGCPARTDLWRHPLYRRFQGLPLVMFLTPINGN